LVSCALAPAPTESLSNGAASPAAVASSTPSADESTQPIPTPSPTDPVVQVEYSQEESDAWAREVFDESLQKLIDAKALNLEMSSYLFEFSFAESEAELTFTSEQPAEELLVGDFSAGSKAIIAEAGAGMLPVVAMNQEAESGLPAYFPSSANEEGSYDDVDPQRFANYVTECDRLLIWGGFEADRESKYYEDGTDRVTTATLVFVIDVTNGKLLHIESVGTDRPESEPESTNGTGYTMSESANEYIAELLRG
jgi:hypothetical protein